MFEAVQLFMTLLLLKAVIAELSNTLVLSSVVLRHGDRTPDRVTFPNDPQINNDYPPYGRGGLTLAGKRRSYKLGQNLRNRYNSLLGSVYSENLAEIVSSDKPRTLMTLQAVLAALFPTNTDGVVASGQTWQPVYYTYIPKEHDELIQTWVACPKVLDVSNYQPTNEEKTLWDYVSYHSGLHITNPNEMLLVQDALLREEQMGYDLPEWAKSVWPEAITNAAIDAWKPMSRKKLSTTVGNLLNKIADDTLKKAQSTLVPADRKLFIYGGHDLNIVALLGALESYENELPEYNAHLLFELHLIDGKYEVQVFHKNGEGSNPKQLEVPGCGMFCPVESFVKFARRFKPVVWCS